MPLIRVFCDCLRLVLRCEHVHSHVVGHGIERRVTLPVVIVVLPNVPLRNSGSTERLSWSCAPMSYVLVGWVVGDGNQS
jgi:hypothetical protein